MVEPHGTTFSVTSGPKKCVKFCVPIFCSILAISLLLGCLYYALIAPRAHSGPKYTNSTFTDINIEVISNEL